MLWYLLHAAIAVALATAGMAASAAIVARLLPRAPGYVAVVAAAAVLPWLALTIFEITALVGAFSWWAGLLALIGVALATGGSPATVAAAMGALARSAASEASEAAADGVARAAMLAMGALGLFALVRALLLPPLAWDTMTYHLVHAGRYVAAGRRAPEIAPDAWGYYEYYPSAGDILWAWAMLPFHGDSMVGAATVAVWAWAAASTYGLGRALGLDAPMSALQASVLAATPALYAFAGAAYVDNLLYASFASGSLFLVRYLQGSSEAPRAEVALAVVAFAVGAGAKLSGALLLVLAVAAIAMAGRNHRDLLMVGLAAPALVPYLRAWVDQGSPTWPFAVAFGGFTLFAGNAQNIEVQNGSLLDENVEPARILIDMFVRSYQYDAYLNLGPAFLVLLLLAPFALPDSFRASRAATWWLLAAAALTILPLFTSSFRGQLSIWFWVLGRLLLPAAGVVVLLTARQLPYRFAWATLLVIQLLWAAPTGVSSVEVPLLAGAMAGLVGAVALATRIEWPSRLGIAVVTTAAFAASHDANRHRFWELAHDDGGFFVLHPLRPELMAPELWKRLDDGEPHRIAMSAGFTLLGHNWYRYPLLGSRLQNEVVYVPPTRSGQVVDTMRAELIEPQLDLRSWAGRLRDQQVDHVFAGAPPPPEDRWLRARPDCFELVASEGENRLYAVTPEGLAACAR